jgi:uncharacterized protein (DUF952 family)
MRDCGLMILLRKHYQSSNLMKQNIVFKIATAEEWSESTMAGKFLGSADDYRDGFIHLSSQHQLAGTLEKHFKGKRDLVLIAFEADKLGSALKWEHSRGGDLFPHLYTSITVSDALWQRHLTNDENGVPQIDEEWFAC